MPQQLGREARDVGRLPAHLGDQPFHRDARRLVELRRRRERRRRVLGDATRIPVDERAVVERLRAARLAQRPLRFAARRSVARRQAEAARDEVLVEQREAGRQARNAQRRLHRRRTGLEAHRRLDVPDLRLVLRHAAESRARAPCRRTAQGRAASALPPACRCGDCSFKSRDAAFDTRGVPSLHQREAQVFAQSTLGEQVDR